MSLSTKREPAAERRKRLTQEKLDCTHAAAAATGASAGASEMPGLDELCAMYPDGRRSELNRFLDMKHGNVEEASELYQGCVEWRAATFPIAIDTTLKQLLHNRVFYHLPGTAADGSSILVFHGPHHRPRRFSREETMRSIVSVVEPVFQARGDDVRFTLLLYMPRGSPLDLKGLKHLSSTFKKYYPRTLAKAIVFPVSPMTGVLFRMAKVFLGKRTTAKVVLMRGGATPTGLATYVDPELTPSLFLGPTASERLSRTAEPELLPALDGDLAFSSEEGPAEDDCDGGGGGGAEDEVIVDDELALEQLKLELGDDLGGLDDGIGGEGCKDEDGDEGDEAGSTPEVLAVEETPEPKFSGRY